MESARMTTSNRNHYVISPPTTSETNQMKDDQTIGNFGCRAVDVPPFLMNETVVRLAPSYEPANHSISQQTTVTTLSRENSAKCLQNSQIYANEYSPQRNDITKNSFAEKLMKCTQKVLIFKTEVNFSPTINEELKLMKKVSNGSIRSGNTISPSSLKEIDEEEFTSNDIAQNKDIHNEPSWLATTFV